MLHERKIESRYGDSVVRRLSTDLKERAEYGAEVIKNLALKITPRYGTSYNKRNLDYYKRFYLLFPDIQIVNTCVHNLSWSHIRRIRKRIYRKSLLMRLRRLVRKKKQKNIITWTFKE